jgi:hypothetical protein
MNDDVKGMRATLAQRFGEEVAAIPAGQGPYGWPQSCPETWSRLAARGSCRRFAERPVAPGLIETLCALALCALTKSDLQQRDIVIVESRRARINELLSTGPLAQDWIPARRRFSFSAATTAGSGSCISGAASRSSMIISTPSSMRPLMRASRFRPSCCRPRRRASAAPASALSATTPAR